MKTQSGSRLVIALALMTCGWSRAWAQASPVSIEEAEASVRQQVLKQCFVCHGLQGESASDKYPRLAGLPAAYIAAQLQAFQSGQRPSETMIEIVRAMSVSDMQALGHYFERQGPAGRTTSIQ